MTFVANAFASIAPRLGALIRVLASPQDGEALGAARAIGRVLTSAGLDFHDLAACRTGIFGVGWAAPRAILANYDVLRGWIGSIRG